MRYNNMGNQIALTYKSNILENYTKQSVRQGKEKQSDRENAGRIQNICPVRESFNVPTYLGILNLKKKKKLIKLREWGFFSRGDVRKI